MALAHDTRAASWSPRGVLLTLFLPVVIVIYIISVAAELDVNPFENTAETFVTSGPRTVQIICEAPGGCLLERRYSYSTGPSRECAPPRARDAGVCIQLLYKRSLRLPICASPASNDGILVYWNRTANVAALQRSSTATSRRLSPLMEDLSVKWHEVDRVSSIEGQVHWSQVSPVRAPEGLFPEAPDHEAAMVHEHKDESEREWIRRRMLAAGAEAARRALEAEGEHIERKRASDAEAKAKADRQLQFDDPFFNDPPGFDDDPGTGGDDFGGGGFNPPPGVSPPPNFPPGGLPPGTSPPPGFDDPFFNDPPGFDDPFFNDPNFAFNPGFTDDQYGSVFNLSPDELDIFGKQFAGPGGFGAGYGDDQWQQGLSPQSWNEWDDGEAPPVESRSALNEANREGFSTVYDYTDFNRGRPTAEVGISIRSEILSLQDQADGKKELLRSVGGVPIARGRVLIQHHSSSYKDGGSLNANPEGARLSSGFLAIATDRSSSFSNDDIKETLQQQNRTSCLWRVVRAINRTIDASVITGGGGGGGNQDDVQIGGLHNVRVRSAVIDELNDINGDYSIAQVVLSGQRSSGTIVRRSWEYILGAAGGFFTIMMGAFTGVAAGIRALDVIVCGGSMSFGSIEPKNDKDHGDKDTKSKEGGSSKGDEGDDEGTTRDAPPRAAHGPSASAATAPAADSSSVHGAGASIAGISVAGFNDAAASSAPHDSTDAKAGSEGQRQGQGRAGGGSSGGRDTGGSGTTTSQQGAGGESGQQVAGFATEV